MALAILFKINLLFFTIDKNCDNYYDYFTINA